MVNPALPDPTLILAGILTQITFEKIVVRTRLEKQLSLDKKYFEISWRLAIVTNFPGLGWIQISLLSIILAIFSVIRTPRKHKLLRGIFTLFGTFILHVSIGSVGFTEIYNLDDHLEYRITLEFFQYATTPIFASAAVVVVANYLKIPRGRTTVRFDVPTETTEETSLRSRLQTYSPGSAVLLTGVCAQLTFEKLFSILITSYPTAPDFCALRGIGSWIQLLSLSTFLVFIVLCVRSGQHKSSQGVATFFSSFILNFSLGHIGEMGTYCGSQYSSRVRDVYRYGTIPLVALTALVCFAGFLVTFEKGRSSGNFQLQISSRDSAAVSENSTRN